MNSVQHDHDGPSPSPSRVAAIAVVVSRSQPPASARVPVQTGFTSSSRDRDVSVAPRSCGVRTVHRMVPLPRFVRSLGNAGAVANAYRACEERKLNEARIDALAARLAPVAQRRGRTATA